MMGKEKKDSVLDIRERGGDMGISVWFRLSSSSFFLLCFFSFWMPGYKCMVLNRVVFFFLFLFEILLTDTSIPHFVAMPSFLSLLPLLFRFIRTEEKIRFQAKKSGEKQSGAVYICLGFGLGAYSKTCCSRTAKCRGLGNFTWLPPFFFSSLCFFVSFLISLFLFVVIVCNQLSAGSILIQNRASGSGYLHDMDASSDREDKEVSYVEIHHC